MRALFADERVVRGNIVNQVVIHVVNGQAEVKVLPEGVEVMVIDLDADEPETARYFLFGGDVMEELLEPPNIIRGETRIKGDGKTIEGRTS